MGSKEATPNDRDSSDRYPTRGTFVACWALAAGGASRTAMGKSTRRAVMTAVASVDRERLRIRHRRMKLLNGTSLLLCAERRAQRPGCEQREHPVRCSGKFAALRYPPKCG